MLDRETEMLDLQAASLLECQRLAIHQMFKAHETEILQDHLKACLNIKMEDIKDQYGNGKSHVDTIDDFSPLSLPHLVPKNCFLANPNPTAGNLSLSLACVHPLSTPFIEQL